MKRLLDYDGPIFRAMELVGRWIILNLLTAICSIPIITVGACLAAQHKVMQEIVMENQPSIFVGYFRAMRANFKQATVLWLLTLLTAAAIGADLYLIGSLLNGLPMVVLFAVVCVVGALLAGVITCTYSFLVRYENKLSEHIRNALYVMMNDLPKFLGITLMSVLPFILAVCSLYLFVQSLAIWAVIGISCLIYMQTRLLRPVFEELERSCPE